MIVTDPNLYFQAKCDYSVLRIFAVRSAAELEK